MIELWILRIISGILAVPWSNKWTLLMNHRSLVTCPNNRTAPGLKNLFCCLACFHHASRASCKIQLSKLAQDDEPRIVKSSEAPKWDHLRKNPRGSQMRPLTKEPKRLQNEILRKTPRGSKMRSLTKDPKRLQNEIAYERTPEAPKWDHLRKNPRGSKVRSLTKEPKRLSNEITYERTQEAPK